MEYVPTKFPIDHKNTFYADPYTVWGFKTGYRAPKGWSAFVDLKNLTNEIYAATTGVVANANGNDSAQFLPGDGRAVFAGVEVSF